VNGSATRAAIRKYSERQSTDGERPIGPDKLGLGRANRFINNPSNNPTNNQENNPPENNPENNPQANKPPK
jgi:hypothetical protein